jgi:hypothetical protein
MTSKALPTSFSRVLLYMILCTRSALMAAIASNAPAEKGLYPVLSSVPAATPSPADVEASSFEFASHPAVPVPVSKELPMEQLVAALGRRTGAGVRAPVLDVPAGSASAATAKPPMKLYKPHDTASAAHELNPIDAAKPAQCQSDRYFLVSLFTNICRVFMYRNVAGATYDIYTGWFADGTHVVTVGSALAPGGTGQYNVFSVNGRYGTVCCNDNVVPASGPDSCPAASSHNITRGVTTTGWLSENQASNSGAVLKIVGVNPSNPLPYKSPGQYRLSESEVGLSTIRGLPYPSSKVEGCSNINGSLGYFFASSYSSQSQIPGSYICSQSLTPPTWSYAGGACDGLLGSSLVIAGSTAAQGILTSISTSCDSNGKGRVGVSAITDGGTPWGVAVNKMIAAVP